MRNVLMLKVFFTLFLFSNLGHAGELPNNSYPIEGYARCENEGQTKNNLIHDNWAFVVYLEKAEGPMLVNEYDEVTKTYTKPIPKSETVLVKLSVREFRCTHLPGYPHEFRWIPIQRNPGNRVHLYCKHGPLFGAIPGYSEDQGTIDSGLIPMPRNSRTPEYYDTYGEADFSVPIRKCLSKKQMQMVENGQSVDVEMVTRYYPFGIKGPRYDSRLEVITIKK
jgi:hypothetical protein